MVLGFRNITHENRVSDIYFLHRDIRSNLMIKTGKPICFLPVFPWECQSNPPDQYVPRSPAPKKSPSIRQKQHTGA